VVRLVGIKMVDDTIVKKYRRIFQSVSNEKGWKLPTKPVTVRNLKDAEFMMEAISYFVGGAELKDNKDGTWTIESRGYYHYIGA
jgi:hypothetical protein